MADAIPHAELLRLKSELEPEYQKRHTALRNLRKYWHGDFWRLADSESHPVATIFRDWTQRAADVGPDIKLVHNIVQQVCVKFQTYLSQLPQIRVYVDPPETDNRRRQGTLKERYLYGCWSEGDMVKYNNRMAWYLPLMGDAYLGCWPNTERNLPVPVLRSPEYAWPIMSFDGERENATMFVWKVTEQQALRNFKAYVPKDEQFKTSKVLGRLRKRPNTEEYNTGSVEVIEYTDSEQWCLYVDGNLERGVMHGFGWNLFEHIKFIDVPGEPFGHGAVEQAIAMNEMQNAIESLMMQAVIDNVFPQLVLEDPMKAPEEIEKGPGAILPLNPGGKAYYLNPPVGALAVQEQFAARNEHNIRLQSGMGETEFGQSPASSIVTGKAVDALQSAGSGNTIEMVQGSGIGPGLVKWNEKAIAIGQSVFRDTTMNLYGRETPGQFEIKGKAFALSLKGSQLVGSGRNEVVFNIAYDNHTKLVMALQALGGNLVSRKWSREQIGVVDNAHMEEEILVEHVEDAVLGAMTAMLQTAADPNTALQVEQQANAYLSGDTSAAPAAQPHPLLSAGGPPPPAQGAAPPPGLPAQGPPGLPGLPGPQLPPPQSGPAPAAPAGPQPAQQNGQITLPDAITAFQAVSNLKGRVFLIGQIVQDGSANTIQVAITNPDDKQTLDAALPQYAGKLIYHVVAREPVEPHVEVTPGENAGKQGGSQAAVEALANG